MACLLPVQDLNHKWFSAGAGVLHRQVWCLGCTYQGSASEFSDPEHHAHAAALGVKRRVLTEHEHRAARQGFAEPRKLAEQQFPLLEGVWASVRMFRSEAPLQHAKNAMRQLASAA